MSPFLRGECARPTPQENNASDWMDGTLEGGRDSSFSPSLVDGPRSHNPHSSLPSLSLCHPVGQPRSGDRDLNFSSKTQQADEDKRRRRKIRITDHLSSRIHLLFGVCSSKFSLGLSLMQLLEAGAIVAEKLLSCELILRVVRSSFRLTLASQPAIFANGLKN